jgi:arylsulfatase A-like enzyme
MSRRNGVSRFALAGAVAGLIVGLIEAGLLYSVPRVPTLQKPEIDISIWILAPLIDLVLWGMAGWVLGRLTFAGGEPGRTRLVLAVALLLGFAAGHVAWASDLLRVPLGDLRAFDYLDIAAAGFGFGVALVLGLAILLRQHLPRLATGLARVPVRPLAATCAALVAALIASLVAVRIARQHVSHATPTGPAPSAGMPNIVLITLDTVRADHLSAYGYHRPTTPHLEKLAQQGVLFDSAVAPSSWTLPSHASILTGLLPHQHGANTVYPLPRGPRTLAEILSTLGYATTGFNSNFFYGQEGWGLAQGFAAYQDDRSSLRFNAARTVAGRALADPLYHHFIRPDYYFRRSAEELNRDVLRWFDRKPSRPYFLFINYFDAHYPYEAPGAFASRFGPSPHVPKRRPGALSAGRVKDPLSASDQASLITGYDNCLAYLDEQVGRLVEQLAAGPDGANTIVIITSDHGEAFGEHSTYDHGWDLYREVVHVPLIIAGPGVPSGKRIPNAVRIQEIFPTLLEAILGERPPFDRLSLRRFWKPGFRPEEFDDMAISEVTPSFPDSDVPTSISLMTSEWHMIRSSNGQVELYQWKLDPQEKSNLAELPTSQGVLRALQRRLVAATESSVQPWDGKEYLFALDGPGYSFLRDLAFRDPAMPSPAFSQLRLGACQAYFTRDHAAGPPRPIVPEADLLKSLPYH